MTHDEAGAGRVRHVERMMAPTSGEWVRIGCDCPIGEDHTYADWVARFGVPAGERGPGRTA